MRLLQFFETTAKAVTETQMSEARKPREPRWDYWQFMDHYGIREKAEKLGDYVLPWVNQNRPGNINKMVRDPDYRMISHLALYFKLLRAGKPITRAGTKSTLSKFEAALNTPIQVWRGGGGDYNPNRRNPRPWVSFTMDKRRVKTFSQYAGTYASSAFMLPERTRYWEIELTIPLRDIVGYIGAGGDAEVLVSAKDAKNAQLITGKQQTAGVVENRDTMVENHTTGISPTKLPRETQYDIADNLISMIPALANETPEYVVSYLDFVDMPNVEIVVVDPKDLREQFAGRGTSPIAVDRYASMIQSGTEFDPVIVADEKFIDGGHRVDAYIQAGKNAMRAVDIEPLLHYDWQDAVHGGQE